jgi:hypothetical protein
VEVLIWLACLVWLVQGLVRHRLDFRGGQLLLPMLLWMAALLFGVLRGFAGHGALSYILWESRYLLLMVLCYFLATNTIRTRAHIRQLLTVSLLSMTFFGLEAVYRKVALVDTGLLGVIPEFAYSHESVVFWAALVLLVIAQQAFGAPPWQRLFGWLALPLCGFALMASERRAGQMAVIVGFLAITLIFARAHRKAFFCFCLPVLLAFLVYLPVFWNNSGTLGQPARAVRSLYQPDPRDAASNLYRQMEALNIYTTIRSNPLFGVGFGRPFFIVVIQQVDVSWWPLWNYETHNNIMWLWMKTGPAGFVVFWYLMGMALLRATHLTRTLLPREARGVSLYLLCGIAACLVFDYVDLGFSGPRVCVFLGTLLGVLAVLEQVYTERPGKSLTAGPE